MRQCGFIAGIEIEESPNGPQPDLAAAVCIEARHHGLLTRPIGNVIVLMPPLCITMDQLNKAVEALRASIAEVWDAAYCREKECRRSYGLISFWLGRDYFQAASRRAAQ